MIKVYEVRVRNTRDNKMFNEVLNKLDNDGVKYSYEKEFVPNQITGTALAFKDASVTIIHKSFDIDCGRLNTDASYRNSIKPSLLNEICFNTCLSIEFGDMDTVSRNSLDYFINKKLK